MVQTGVNTSDLRHTEDTDLRHSSKAPIIINGHRQFHVKSSLSHPKVCISRDHPSDLLLYSMSPRVRSSGSGTKKTVGSPPTQAPFRRETPQSQGTEGSTISSWRSTKEIQLKLPLRKYLIITFRHHYANSPKNWFDYCSCIG